MRQSNLAVKFYVIRGRPLTPWGDYGDILQHGMTSHLSRQEGQLRLERTGPYIPAITFPGNVVVNSATRVLLETSGLSGFEFRPVNKALIVELNWEKWEWTAEEPPEFPESGEPEDYILGHQHSSETSDQIGDLWELFVPTSAVIGRMRPIVESLRELHVVSESWNGSDLFRGNGYGGVLVSERAKLWFEENLGDYVQFEEFESR